MEVIKEIRLLVKARYPIIYIVSTEEARIKRLIAEEFEKDRDIYEWSFVKGFRSLELYQTEHDRTKDPLEALKFIGDKKDDGIYILNDFHSFLNSQNLDILRFMKELAEKLKVVRRNIFIIAPILSIPIELEKDIAVIDFPLPTLKEIGKLLNKIKDKMKNYKAIRLNGKNMDKIASALLGLTESEIHNVCYKSLVKTKQFDIGVIIKEKEKIIRKSKVMEYYHATEPLKNLGGFNEFKQWITKKQATFSDEARKFGCEYPKGVLLTGVQGCGKSLSAQMIASLWNFPLVRLNFGALFGSLVGESEANTRKAIKFIESIGQAVWWWEEIDKNLSGMAGGDLDSGVGKRVFGEFLTWLQENKKPIFVVATANDITALSNNPELMRKGRFDEIFFVDLPNDEEREEIFKIHIAKRDRNIDEFEYEELVKLSRGFSGAEIEASIKEALEDAFFEKTDLNTSLIIDNLKKTVPLSTTMEDKITALRNWAKTKARYVSTMDDVKNKEVGIEL